MAERLTAGVGMAVMHFLRRDHEYKTSVEATPCSLTKKITIMSSMHDDATSVILITVIACLVLAISILGSPEAAQLTPGQINVAVLGTMMIWVSPIASRP
jgi:hypothetical protein